MAKFVDKSKVNTRYLETPFTIQQVETHLVFGPLSRHVPIAYLALLVGIVKLAADFSDRHVPQGQRIGGAVWDVLFWIVFLPFGLSRLTRRQQAIIVWGTVKFVFGFAAFMMVAIGGLGGLAEGHSDALPNLFLGLIWIPGFEFIPKITPHQKYVTIARLLLSIPCVYFGVRSGNWHWD